MGYEVESIKQVFEHLIPYVIPYWKEIIRRLGVHDDELVDVQANCPRGRMKDLAYAAMCYWADKVGNAATVAKLVRVLRELDLRRAADAIKMFVIVKKPPKKVEETHQRIRRRKKRRISGLPESTTDSLSAPSLPDSATSEESRRRRKGEIHCRLEPVNLEVRGQSVQNTPQNSGRSDRADEIGYTRRLYAYYEEVFKKELALLKAMAQLTNYQGVLFRRMYLGSVCVVIGVENMEGLKQLKETVDNGRLRRVMRTMLGCKKLIQPLGLEKITFKITIPEEDIKRCEDELVDVEEIVHKVEEQTLEPKYDTVQLSEDALKQCHVELRKFIEDISPAYKSFLSKRKRDMCMTIDMVKPSYVDLITSITELRGYYKNVDEMFFGGPRCEILKQYFCYYEALQSRVLGCKKNFESIIDLYKNARERPDCLESAEETMAFLEEMSDESYDLTNLECSESSSSRERTYVYVFALIPKMIEHLETVDTIYVELWKEC